MGTVLRRCSALFAGCVLFVSASPQLSHQWSATMDGGGLPDGAVDVVTDSVGNGVVAGSVQTAATNYDIVTRKYARDGSVLWTATYDGTAHLADAATAIAMDGAGNVVVVGTTGVGASNLDLVVLKYSKSGALQWSYVYGGSSGGNDAPESVTLDPATGDAWIAGAQNGLFSVWRVRANGTLDFLYVSTWTGASRRVRLDAAGNGYAIGNGHLFGGQDALTLVELGPTGSVLATAQYNRPGAVSTAGQDLVLSPDGQITTVGAFQVNPLNYDALVARFDASLAVQWATVWSAPFWDALFRIERSPFGEFVAVGWATTSNAVFDVLALRLSDAGAIMVADRWDAGAGLNDYPSDLALDPAGNPYLVGTATPSAGVSRLFVRKYDQGLGFVEMPTVFGAGPAGNGGNRVAINRNGDVWVAGTLSSGTEYPDWGVAQFRQSYVLPMFVNLQDWSVSAEGQVVRVLLTVEGVETADTYATLDGGNFGLAHVPFSGLQALRIKGSHWLTRMDPAFEVTPGSLTAYLSLPNGDVNGNDSIGISDFLALRSAFGSVPGNPNWNPEADLNGSGAVNVADFLILRKNFGQAGQ
ncbi:MAG: hypothetical protein KIS66_10025 [Fimbriimonadaceae bacterium]|nr:hypothetical protein [Fimbriimonadaceae bacterium]